MRYSLLSIGTVLGGGALIKGMIGFNARVEDAKNNVAAMLALAGKTGVNEQLKTAGDLYDRLRKRASELPGTTEEYIQAMSRLTYPIMTAGLGMQKLEDMTVATVVAAKGLGQGVKASLTDVVQGIEGRFSTNDFFLKALLEPQGFVGKDGRDRFKALSKKRRAEIIYEGLNQKAIVESAQLQAKSFTGQMDKAKEALFQFLGRVGLPLFTQLAKLLTSANKWLETNKASVERLADTIGGALGTAFTVVGEAIKFLMSNSDEAKAMLWALVIIAGAFATSMLLAFAPLLAAYARVATLVYLFIKLRDAIGTVGAVIAMAFGAALLFKFGAVVKAVKAIASAMWGVRTASLAAAGASALPSIPTSPTGTQLGMGAAGTPAKKGGKGGGLDAAGAFLPIAAAGFLNELTGGSIDMKSMTTWMQGQVGMTTPTVNVTPTNANIANVTSGDTVFNISGVKNAADLEAVMRRVVDEEGAKQLRHVQNAVGGTP